MIWSKEEQLPRDELRKLQLAKLQKLVARVYQNVPFYKKTLDDARVKPEDIKTLDDLRRLPFTVKQEGTPGSGVQLLLPGA